MLNDLSKFYCLGTVQYYQELILLIDIHSDSNWDIENINSYFYNRKFDNKDYIDGGIYFLLYIEAIILKNNKLSLSKTFIEFNSQKRDFNSILISLFLRKVSQEKNDYLKIFNSENFRFNIDFNKIEITKNAFGLKHMNLFEILTATDFLIVEENFNKEFIFINNIYKESFIKIMGLNIRKHHLSPEMLAEINNLKVQNGIVGEEFVLKYENSLLDSSRKAEWVAMYDCSAGYDILSYYSYDSITFDKYIEVKTYSGSHPSFYWTKNEIREAKIKGEKYFLYLVNINKISDEKYIPYIINNPINNVLNNDNWFKEIDTYYITYPQIVDN